MGWISVKDWLPEPGQIVMVHQVYSWEKHEDGAMVTIGRLHPVKPKCKPYWEFQHYRPDFRHGNIMDNGIICPGSEYVTHWMPLPEPPKVVEIDQVKNPGCKYCRDREAIAWDMDNDAITIESDGKLHILAAGSWDAEIEFCPMCGRKLKEGT